MKSKRMLSNRELSSFCGQVALILKAGITPSDGMGILLSDSKDTEGKEIISDILKVCVSGESFCNAIKSTNVFPQYVINMVALGEESGNLDVVMESLSTYYEREENIADSIRSAISYPFVMIGMMLLVIVVLLTKVLPIFNQVFIQLGSEMRGASRTLMNIGNNMQKYSIVIIGVLVVFIILFFLATKTKKGKQITSNFLTRFFMTRNFYENIASGRFASGMALTLSSGLDTYQSLDMVAELVENKKMASKITHCKDLIQNGSNFAEAIAGSSIFSNLYAKMISVGFKTGSVDIVMKKIATNYEKETDNKIRSIISILEPTLVIILSFIVGLILLSVILPLMGIMSSIG